MRRRRSRAVSRYCFFLLAFGFWSSFSPPNANSQSVPSQYQPADCPSIPSNQCLDRPDKTTACSSANVGPSSAWTCDATVMVYIDQSAFWMGMQQEIETIFTNWESARAMYSSGCNVKFAFTITDSIPTVLPQSSYVVSSTGNANLIDADHDATTYFTQSDGTLTNSSLGSGSATMPAATTYISNEYMIDHGHSDSWCPTL